MFIFYINIFSLFRSIFGQIFFMATQRKLSKKFADGFFKRARCRNFSFEDKELLLEMILKKKDIIENRKADAISIKAKEQAWLQIMQEFNAFTTSPRSTMALKTCWENMKRRYRKSRTKEKYNFETSCGQSNLSKYLNDMDLSALEVYSPYDSSAFVYDNDTRNKNSFHGVNKGKLSDSEDLQEDTLMQTSEYFPQRLEMLMSKVLKPVAGNSVLPESSKTVPYVHTLKSCETTSETEVQVLQDPEDVQTPKREEKFSCVNAKNDKSNVKKASPTEYQGKNFADALAESKLELAKLAKEHAIAEEKRKTEIHELLIEKTKLEIEILKLEYSLMN